jgi:hypothetical protein
VIEDLPGRYEEYLARCTSKLGGLAAGAFVKYSGRLIKKLTFEEFTPAYLEYTELLERYTESLDRGDTINDLMLRMVREKAAGLVLDPPV